MLLPLVLTMLGLGLLLAGMNLLRYGLQKYAGIHFQNTLLRLTATPGKGFISGLVATGVLQSSTALTVMAVSFVDTKLIGFENALGLILGSNIGSTITPQLLAFPIKEIAVWLIPPGLLVFVVTKRRIKYLFLAISGLGIMFLSLSVLESAMIPLAHKPQTQYLLQYIGNHYVYSIIAGTILSGLLHSSSAATGIAMVLTEEGWLNLPAALAFIFGANIGTCFTALLVSFFTSRAAQRVAIFHVLLNFFGVIIFYPFLVTMAEIISFLGGNLSRQVANAHTIFNIASSLLALPLLPYATRFLKKIR